MASTGINDFVLRTEDLRPEDVLGLFVATERDEQLVSLLRSPAPLIIEGSRGTGKSLLLRVCEQQQLEAFENDRILPVYVSFNKSSLLSSRNSEQFLQWMLSRLSSQIIRTVQRRGLLVRTASVIKTLSGGTAIGDQPTALEQVAERFENSYKNPQTAVDDSAVPAVEAFRDAVEDLCSELNIRRLNVLFDEAAHIFRAEQQRQFFTLFRDLRSPYLTANAAVYPGVTAYGAVFEMTHDARIESLNRDISSPQYLAQMREIVVRQANSDLQRTIERNGENFDALAYAVTGNPRLLLRTVAIAGQLRNTEVQAVLKDFFRSSIWGEHTSLAERYPGHKELIDWGRDFVEQTVIPETSKKNASWKAEGNSQRTALIWIHRDAPHAAKEALRLLTYTGILTKMDDGVIGTRRGIGTRYLVNVGCLVAPDALPINTIAELRSGNVIKRFTEFGSNYPGFTSISEKFGNFVEADIGQSLDKILGKSIDVLELSQHQKGALYSVGVDTIKSAISSDESTFMKAHYIGPVRSRQIKNVAMAAALEYLSG